jgi:hypothetical protein
VQGGTDVPFQSRDPSERPPSVFFEGIPGVLPYPLPREKPTGTPINKAAAARNGLDLEKEPPVEFWVEKVALEIRTVPLARGRKNEERMIERGKILYE